MQFQGLHAKSFRTRKNSPDGNATMPRWFLCLWWVCQQRLVHDCNHTQLMNQNSIATKKCQKMQWKYRDWRLPSCVNKEIHFNISILEIKLDLWINVNTDSIMRTEYCGEQQLWKRTKLLCFNIFHCTKQRSIQRLIHCYQNCAHLCRQLWSRPGGNRAPVCIVSLIVFCIPCSIYWVPKGSKRI